MSFWYWFFGILGVILVTLFILGFPRKKNHRIPSMEGIDDPAVAKAFERMNNFLPFKILRRRIISELKKLHPTGTLVDVGCGTGHLLIQIARQFSLELIGLDISNEILEHARERAEKAGLLEHIEFKTGSAEQLPFPDNSIDYIVSSFSLHHWVNPTTILQEILRVLKKGGFFLIFDFRRDARKFFYGLFTFATKIVVPKALKRVHEPLGSLQASYTLEEALQLFSKVPVQTLKTIPYLSWMFIIGQK
ncbi:MAG: class I SAM-dependent methyltransferase [Candidatus Helarchaeota archaeon]